MATEEEPHISDVAVWGGPDRNYFTFVVLSVVLGFFGLDHVYLRSFSTALQKFLVNMLTLGFWYVWDVLQVLTEGDVVRREGLSSPLDWVRGIGRGVFVGVGGGDDAEQPQEAQKSYIVYSLLAVLFGAFGLDRLYMGSLWQAIAKAGSCLFLVGWVWVLWDSYHAVFATRSILKEGLAAPPVFDAVFSTPLSSDPFRVRPIVPGTPKEGWMDWIAHTLGFPGVPTFDIVKDVVQKTVEIATIVGRAQTAALPTRLPAAAVAAALPTGLPAALSILPNPAALPSAVSAALPVPQTGGAVATANSGPGPVLAGALTALVVAGGAKGIYDFVSHQYG